MANKKISELNEASSLNNSDVMPVVQGNETKKSALTTLISFLNSKLSFLKSSDISTTISSSSTDDKVASAKAVYTYAPPKSHAASGTTYGVGTTSNYGHCRTINNLTTSSHTNGYALSAYQGYLLNQNKQAKLTAGTNITIDSNNVISASGGGGGNYSTTEQVVGTWYDGKPLYEKTIVTTTPTVTTDGTSANVTADITTNIEKVFIVTSFVEYSGGGSVWTCPYYSSSMLYVKTQIVQAGGQRKVQIVSDGTVYNNSTLVAVVRYTKTTDTATT